jgi:hypothetical protein
LALIARKSFTVAGVLNRLAPVAKLRNPLCITAKGEFNMATKKKAAKSTAKAKPKPKPKPKPKKKRRIGVKTTKKGAGPPNPP